MQVPPAGAVSADGKLIASFGETRRIPVRIADVPARLKNAVLSAEDANFYNHPGVDWHGIARAGIHVIVSGGDKGPGGSTITQQVARNFFLSPEKLYSRKLTEMFIALRMENELSKDQILELYINKMFLGHRSYGVAAAASYYYGKTLDQLTVAEGATLASTFQLPSVVNPLNNQKRGLVRRNWVLGQMLSNRFITQAEYDQAVAEPNDAYPHEPADRGRRPLPGRNGPPADPRQARQRRAHRRLRRQDHGHQHAASRRQTTPCARACPAYDRRHGYRGPEAHEELAAEAGTESLDRVLAGYTDVAGMLPGIVTQVDRPRRPASTSRRTETSDAGPGAVDWARPTSTTPASAPRRRPSTPCSSAAT